MHKYRISLGLCGCITIGILCIYSTKSTLYKTAFDPVASLKSVFRLRNQEVQDVIDNKDVKGNISASNTTAYIDHLDISQAGNNKPDKRKNISKPADLTFKPFLAEETNITQKSKDSRMIPNLIRDNKHFPVVYEKCTKIPKSSTGTAWAEEEYLQEPEVTNVLEMADGKRSKIWIEGNDVVRVGESVRMKLHLYDGFGNPRITGGDLVRVWIKEPSKGASSNTKVIDHQNGSYSAIITAFWVGRPQVMAAIISPRQVIAAAFKRRYMCPPVLLNLAVFQHPDNKMIKEHTPCNYDPQVTGYPDICNLTETNYGSPWYCGKPINPNLMCQHWTMASDRNLWLEGIEQKHTSKLTLEILNLKYKAVLIPTQLTFIVNTGIDNKQRVSANDKCNNINWKKTWSSLKPSGYLYNRKWNNRHCVRNTSAYNLTSCVKGTNIVIIGDSTTRQIFTSIEKMLPCTWITESWSKVGKHSPAVCVNRKLNYTISWKTHQLPFCTTDNPIRNLKSVTEYLHEISDSSKTIIILHIYAHFLNHHSHVFYETLQHTKMGIVNFLDKNSNTKILIKGPHAYSFDKKNPKYNLWQPDKYADIYSKMIHEEFKDLSDRVIYLDSFDITVSTEQWFIHPEDYIVDELSRNIFSYVCLY